MITPGGIAALPFGRRVVSRTSLLVLMVSQAMYRLRSGRPLAAILLGVVLSPFCIAQDVEALRSGVVKIVATRVEEGMGKTKTGTGFIVDLYPDAAIIVTASHVVEDTDKIAVQFSVRGDVTFSAEVKRMRGADPRGLAVLAVKNPPTGLVTLNFSNDGQVTLTDDVTALGFPRISPSFSALPGKVASRDGTDIVFTAGVDEGSSGGPLVKGGQVVGVVVEAAGATGRAIPAFIVIATLDGWGFAVKDGRTSAAEGQSRSPAAAAGDAARAASYPETAEALKRMFESMLEAARSGDNDKAQAFARQLVIPNYETWFSDTFGATNGAKLAADYKGFVEASQAGQVWDFNQLMERAKRGISAYGVREPDDPKATGGQKTVLEAMKKPIALYGVRLDGLHLWNFVYVEGSFRMAGKMYQSLRAQ